MKNWTTKDLLYTILEFISMVPNSNEWKEKSLEYNEPRLIRFKRIKSLLTAFELPHMDGQKYSMGSFRPLNKKVIEANKDYNIIISFLKGDFIQYTEMIEYPNVNKMIEKENEYTPTRVLELNDIVAFYRHLMKYRIEIDNTLRFNNKFMEVGGLGFRTAFFLTSETNNRIFMEVDKIDRLLFEIINPLNIDIHQNLLVEEFDFPVDDLERIDLENW